MHMKVDSCIKRHQSVIAEGTLEKGTPRKMWDEIMRKDLHMLGLTEQMTGN